MSKIHGRNTRVYLNGTDISNYFNSANVTKNIDTAETSGFGDADKTYVVGLGGGDIKLAGFFDAGAAPSVDSLVDGLLGSETDPILSVISASLIDASGATAMGNFKAKQIAAPIGGVVTTSADLEADTSGVHRTLTAFPLGTLTPAVAGGTTAVYNGGTATSLGGQAFLQMGSVVAGTPVVAIEHSTDGATAWSAWMTFAAVLSANAPQAQRATVTGTVKPYKRVTVTGGTAVCWVGFDQPLA